MQYARLGRSELNVSRLCLGSMNFGAATDAAAACAILDRATAGGINFIDTANIYSSWVAGHSGGESETVIGEWLRSKNRHELVIATKVRGRMWAGSDGEGLSRRHILRAAEDSLRRLQTDYIDLYQAHWFDAATPLDETLAAFDALVQAGKVRYIGVSNVPAWRLMKACWRSDANGLARYDTLQPHYSLFHRAEYEAELAAVCADQQIGVLPYSPLAAGFATGKYTRASKSPENSRAQGRLIQGLIDDENAYRALDVLRAIAAGHQAPMAQAALAWLLAKPTVTSAIIGARTVEQLDATIGATALRLSADELHRLDAATAMF